MVNKKTRYIPNKGDIVWTDFNPAKGHEQKGRRPAIVISSQLFNSKTGMAYMCPITNTQKPYSFRVEYAGQLIRGFIMCDQLKSFDWNDRNVEFIECADDATIKSISNVIEVIME